MGWIFVSSIFTVKLKLDLIFLPLVDTDTVKAGFDCVASTVKKLHGFDLTPKFTVKALT
jgi:hypothetical protein